MMVAHVVLETDWVSDIGCFQGAFLCVLRWWRATKVCAEAAAIGFLKFVRSIVLCRDKLPILWKFKLQIKQNNIIDMLVPFSADGSN